MKKHLIIILLFGLFIACVEPFEFEGQTFENALVVQALISSELKNQQVLLSRAVRFAESTIVSESNATVSVFDQQQNEFVFQEAEVGKYVSMLPFAAQKGVKYSLVIKTDDGTIYKSLLEGFEVVGQIEDLYAERGKNDKGTDGMSIFIDGSGAGQYYRYEYEETYKIIAPNWTPNFFKLTNYDPCGLPTITYDLEIVYRYEEKNRICYNTLNSNEIIQNSTVNLAKNESQRFPIHFVTGDDFILSHRYSILVKQYVQSFDAFSYYQNLLNFSSSDNIFSEIQPGFLNGNIVVEGSEDKKVLGYFEVASVSEKRLFFDRQDFYPDAPLPLFVNKCNPFTAPLEHQSFCNPAPNLNPCPQSLIQRINLGLISYVSGNTEGGCSGPYMVVPRVCGDCTVLGSTEKPDFWVD